MLSCLPWSLIGLPCSVEKPVLSPFAVHLGIPSLPINVCYFDFSFEMLITSAWFPHILSYKQIT